jgi:hypothetical protein
MSRLTILHRRTFRLLCFAIAFAGHAVAQETSEDQKIRDLIRKHNEAPSDPCFVRDRCNVLQNQLSAAEKQNSPVRLPLREFYEGFCTEAIVQQCRR